MEIPSTRPHFSEEDIAAILKEAGGILKSGRLILGPYTAEFEKAFREYCGVKHAVAVSSCTAALEIALRYFDVSGKEVIVPTNTFIATANSVIYSGGRPILADIKPDTLCLDPAEILKLATPDTRGVIVVHLAGLPCPDIEEIKEICRHKGLFLIEDVAHAHGAMINNRKTGSLGDAGCFSFYPTKVMTTCTGGMITTDDDRLAEFGVSLRHHGVGAGLHHIINLGADWLMDEISAVLGVYQLKALEHHLEQRNDIARRYAEALADVEGIRLFKVAAGIRHSYYKYPIFLSPAIGQQELVDMMKNKFGVEVGTIYDPPCHLQPVYKRLYGFHHGMFPVADQVLEQTRCLPMFPQMTAEEFDYIIQSLKTCLKSTGPKVKV